MISDALLWGGAVLVAVGAGLFHPGFGLMVGGTLVICLGFLAGIPSKEE